MLGGYGSIAGVQDYVAIEAKARQWMTAQAAAPAAYLWRDRRDAYDDGPYEAISITMFLRIYNALPLMVMRRHKRF